MKTSHQYRNHTIVKTEKVGRWCEILIHYTVYNASGVRLTDTSTLTLAKRVIDEMLDTTISITARRAEIAKALGL